ncbi:response regulator transcription factor [Leptolyngbya sp. FACHB-16]|uniref:response regulator transcription factor n=1 Tax=unclassified Leptolyngbya TaxID=2650499 RepID=UPI001681F685|nr:response regulator transcription factor [Leptolyngbya sp. FACHB-16]MBD2157869.1 response regulator transcription factor [Leptolyngbya sp. FACHB-16]
MENVSSFPRLSSYYSFSNAANSTILHGAIEKQTISSEYSISIISNSHLLCEALSLLLNAHQPACSCNYYTSSTSTIPIVVASNNHVVLLDSGIGRDLTIERIRQWRSLTPSPYVVVLELKHDTELILDCIEAGAHAYALQGASSTDITQVIEQVYQGTFQCPPELTAKLFDRLAQPKNTLQSTEKVPLTRRELEVLRYVAQEYSDREIATQLIVEVRTVKHHVHNILQKLKVKNRWNAAQLAIKNSWLDLTL